jgi:hypothetical protein
VLLGRQLFDRRIASHQARRSLYVDLLTMPKGRREYMQEARGRKSQLRAGIRDAHQKLIRLDPRGPVTTR